MSEIDNLTWEELTTQLEQEIADLGGTNSKETEEDWNNNPWEQQEEEENKEDLEDDWDDDDDWEDNWEKTSKSSKKIKKLLAQRNEERKKTAELESKIKELEQKQDIDNFYSKNPDAKNHSDNIEEMIKARPELTRDEAFILTANKQILEDRKSPWNKIIWNTPSANLRDKKAGEMTSKELDNKVREMYKSWKISI